MNAAAILQTQRAFFASGATRGIPFRLEQLRKLKRGLIKHEAALMAALRADLNKPALEAYASEIGVTLAEVNTALRSLRGWARPKPVMPHITQLPNSAWVMAEPLGATLIIGPWNYPVVLILAPLIAAISAGNCAVIKPSELAPATSQALADLLADTFDPRYVAVMQGGADVAGELLNQRWDKIFYTGGERVGKIVALAAAKNLTPVTLELGGKSPCVADASADVDMAARRIVWGKFWNAGQTCIAPDYVLVQKSIAPALVEAMKKHIAQFYPPLPPGGGGGGQIATIINQAHFTRLRGYLADGVVACGGQTDPARRFIAPTLLTQVPPDSPVMTDEIFGPILPVLEYDTLSEAMAFVNARPKPLAFYIFSRDSAAQKAALEGCSFGGGCVNDTIVHFAQTNLPFGGVGSSGMGNYHGKYGFDAFSNFKGVLKKGFLSSDYLVRYPPHTSLKQKLAKLFLR